MNYRDYQTSEMENAQNFDMIKSQKLRVEFTRKSIKISKYIILSYDTLKGKFESVN